MLAEGNQQALDVEYRMGQALIALETLGYTVTPNAGVTGAELAKRPIFDAKC